jgi:hypothetical protein
MQIRMMKKLDDLCLNKTFRVKVLVFIIISFFAYFNSSLGLISAEDPKLFKDGLCSLAFSILFEYKDSRDKT